MIAHSLNTEVDIYFAKPRNGWHQKLERLIKTCSDIFRKSFEYIRGKLYNSGKRNGFYNYQRWHHIEQLGDLLPL